LTPADAKRRLLWQGMLIFGLGLLTGAVVPVMTNPRMGVAAHVGGVMSGMFLILVGLLWDQIKLSLRAEKAAFWFFCMQLTPGGWRNFLPLGSVQAGLPRSLGLVTGGPPGRRIWFGS